MSHSVDNDFRDSGGINKARFHSKHRKSGKINIHSRQCILHNTLYDAVLIKTVSSVAREPNLLIVALCSPEELAIL